MGFSNDPRVAETFLVNTTLRRHDRETEISIENYFTDSSVVMLSMLDRTAERGFRQIRLPSGARLDMKLGETINWRRSVRSYTGDAIDLQQVAALTSSAAAVTCHVDVGLVEGGEATLSFRAAPSGGGLYPVQLYLAALRVDGLQRGIYRYDPLEHQLCQTGDAADVGKLLECFAVSDDVLSINRASLIFLLVGTAWRSMRKYGDRGLRFVFLESGAMAQQIHLAAVALGLGSVDCASVYEDEAHEVIRLDGLQEALLHTVVVGVPG
jgi:SagB-type dehydrogenase family enzyme